MHKSRPLTLPDIAHVMSRIAQSPDPRVSYDAVGALAKECCGWRLLTALKYVEAEACVERLWSSDPTSYPVGGRKPLDKISASHGAMDKGEVFLAATKDDVRKAFFDHELIFSLGITSILNIPIRLGNKRLGTLNFCGEEGMYGARQVGDAKILGGLLTPALVKAMIPFQRPAQ